MEALSVLSPFNFDLIFEALHFQLDIHMTPEKPKADQLNAAREENLTIVQPRNFSNEKSLFMFAFKQLHKWVSSEKKLIRGKTIKGENGGQFLLYSTIFTTSPTQLNSSMLATT